MLRERKNHLTRINYYNSFMLRFRRLGSDDAHTWIISLQNTHTGQQMIFPNLDGLIHFLRMEFDHEAEQEDACHPAPRKSPGIAEEDISREERDNDE